MGVDRSEDQRSHIQRPGPIRIGMGLKDDIAATSLLLRVAIAKREGNLVRRLTESKRAAERFPGLSGFPKIDLSFSNFPLS